MTDGARTASPRWPMKAEASSRSPSSFLAPEYSEMHAVPWLDGRDGKEFRHAAGDSTADGRDRESRRAEGQFPINAPLRHLAQVLVVHVLSNFSPMLVFPLACCR